MAEVITQFKLETTQFDSKLRDAAQGLKNVVNVASNAGKSFTGFSQEAIKAAQSLGQIESGANNVKDRVKDLVGSFNDAAKAYNKLSEEQRNSDFGKALAGSLQQLQGRIQDAKQELYGLGDAINDVKSKSSGLFGEGGFAGMLQVAGGNLLAQGITKIGAEIADTLNESVKLAREAEGVRIAFDRLDDPTLLDALKEATHGTVSELELMKQAIKFENFKLPLEDLATYLAFAQQKAKDTGESIDYLVNSIVNGLGRQSKQILDNLGISAAELTKRMNEGKTMTQAVAEIIREEMSKAGDYVETAADRAARAAADAKNKMVDFGNEAMPVAEQWEQGFNAIKLAGMDLLTTVLGPLMRSAASIQQILNGGGFKFKPGIPNLADGPIPSPTRQPGKDHVVQAPGGYVEITDRNTGAVIGGKHFDDLKDTNTINAWRKTLAKAFNTSNKSHTDTPQEKAAKRMADAQHKYELSLEKAKAELDSGTITEAEFKKVQKRAAESLFEAADDAYQTFADPQYKAVKDDAKQKFVALGGEIKTLTETEKANQKAAREQEQAQKKLAEAQRKQADAMERGNMKDYTAASKQVREAEKEVARLGGTNTFENTEQGDINIPVGLKVDDSALKSFTEQVDQKLGTSPIPFQFALNQENVTALIENLKTQLGQADVGSELFNSLLEKLGNAQLLSDSINKGISDSVDSKTGKRKKREGDTTMDKASKALGGLNSIAGGLEKMGVELPSEIKDLVGVIEGVMAVIQGVQTVISVFQTSALTANTIAIGALTTAMWANVTTGFIPFFKTGGIVPHAANGMVIPGNNYSDNVPILASSGELILNKAAQGNLASQLAGNNEGVAYSSPTYTNGETIVLGVNNHFRRTGQGEIVTTSMLRRMGLMK